EFALEAGLRNRRYTKRRVARCRIMCVPDCRKSGPIWSPPAIGREDKMRFCKSGFDAGVSLELPGTCAEARRRRGRMFARDAYASWGRRFCTIVHRFAQMISENPVDARCEEIYCAPRSKRNAKAKRSDQRKRGKKRQNAPSSEMRSRA